MLSKYISSLTLLAFSFGIGLQAASTAPCICTCPGHPTEPTPDPVAQGFHEDWSQGISPQRWYLFRKIWGAGNNGCVPELVSIQKDVVDGTARNVLVITTQGNQTTSSIMGVKKSGGQYVKGNSPKRVGGCIATAEYFASGTYEIKMKVGRPKNKPTAAPSGLCPAIWTFHYEEHYPSANDPQGVAINPKDPIYQPRYKEGSDADGYYSTVNSEIDAPELGKDGNLNLALFTTYESEVEGNTQGFNLSKFGINVLDNQYHTYRFIWKTNLAPTNLTDSQVILKGNYYYAANNPTSDIQGCAVVKQSGTWYVYKGVSVDFYVDGKFIGRSTDNVSPVSARLIVGGWFPSWAGTPSWDETKIYVSDITIIPANNPGDVLFQPETYPTDGLVPPS